jgi:hypothetical protein
MIEKLFGINEDFNLHIERPHGIPESLVNNGQKHVILK